jgi:hypothetical protein
MTKEKNEKREEVGSRRTGNLFGVSICGSAQDNCLVEEPKANHGLFQTEKASKRLPQALATSNSCDPRRSGFMILVIVESNNYFLNLGGQLASISALLAPSLRFQGLAALIKLFL